MRKHYINIKTGEDTASAAQAIIWHRNGDLVQVNTFYDEPHKTGLANVVHVPGADPAKKECSAANENRAHCKHIAKEIEAYADGNVYHCPECGEEIRMPDDVGDKYRCPHCHTVADIDDYEQLSVWDFLSDVFDIEYRCSSSKEYRSVRIMVACGGPNIYIDTADAMVKLYWWNERAEYPLSYEARDAIDEWAEEYWNCC